MNLVLITDIVLVVHECLFGLFQFFGCHGHNVGSSLSAVCGRKRSDLTINLVLVGSLTRPN